MQSECIAILFPTVYISNKCYFTFSEEHSYIDFIYLIFVLNKPNIRDICRYIAGPSGRAV